MKDLTAAWATIAHKILASVMVDDGAIFPVLDVLGKGTHWFPSKEAAAWAGVLRCMEEGVPPSVEAVGLRCQSDNGYLQAIANGWTDDDNRQVVYLAGELKRLGSLAELHRIGAELQAVEKPDDLPAAVEYTEHRLSGIMAETSGRKGDAEAVSESAWGMVERFQGRGILSGLSWFDDITGGMWPGLNYWIVGNYKAGKSTCMRNLVLSALEQGQGADVYCAEGSRELFTLDCQAMIATRLLCEWGERDARKLRMSGMFLLRVWRDRLPTLTKAELEAVEQARTTWCGYNVRVWDANDGITDLATLRHLVQRSKFDHGSLVHWADYSQLFNDRGGTIYERQSATALAVQRIAQREGVVFGMLSQRNEAAINAGTSGYSIGVKGGGEASAASDATLLPMIDHEAHGQMSVELKYSRYSGLGKGSHTINPTSGLILDRWVRPGGIEL